jgi:CHAT domain-containing protein
LLLPVEKFIKDKELIIVPDAAFSDLSFDALVTEPGEGNPMKMYIDEPYLLRQHPIGYSFSATFLVNTENKKFPFWKSFIGFAPDYTHSPDSLDNIPEGYSSLKSISRLFFGKAITGMKATEKRFKDDNSYNILNFYTHGIDDTLEPSLSRMFFSPDKSQGQDSYLYAYEISNMQINSNLAVLVTCYSGSGVISKGEGVLSIGRSFANAGCPSMILSLWQTSSGMAFKIMKEFYRELIKGNGKTKALQTAKLKYIRQANPIDADPKVWSGLVLIGNTDALFQQFILSVYILPAAGVLLLLILFLLRKKLAKLF